MGPGSTAPDPASHRTVPGAGGVRGRRAPLPKAAATPTPPPAIAVATTPPTTNARRRDRRQPRTRTGAAGAASAAARYHPRPGAAISGLTRMRASSSAVGRSLGRRLRQRTTMGRTARGTRDRSNRPVEIWISCWNMVPSLTSGCPVEAKNSVAPRAKMSLAALASPPPTNSGAR